MCSVFLRLLFIFLKLLIQLRLRLWHRSRSGRDTLTAARAADSFRIYFIYLALLPLCEKLQLYKVLLIVAAAAAVAPPDWNGELALAEANFINLIYTFRIHRNSYFPAFPFLMFFFLRFSFSFGFSFCCTFFICCLPTPGLRLLLPLHGLDLLLAFGLRKVSPAVCCSSS